MSAIDAKQVEQILKTLSKLGRRNFMDCGYAIGDDALIRIRQNPTLFFLQASDEVKEQICDIVVRKLNEAPFLEGLDIDRIFFPRREQEIFDFLFKQRDTWVSSERLFLHLYGNTEMECNAHQSHVSKLRSKLERHGSKYHIYTRRFIGYMLTEKTYERKSEKSGSPRLLRESDQASV